MNKKELLDSFIERLKNNESVIYILVYDTKNNARASVKYIYDLALTLRENNFNAKLIVEEKNYTGVENWLGDKYKPIPILVSKEDKITINVDDTIIVPEYYSNALPQFAKINCNKIMLIQQKEYIYETLPIGFKWSNYGFNRVITTTESTKKYIQEYFPEVITHIIPPMIGDNFKKYDGNKKPLIAINCRDRSVNKKIISEFYLKFPHLRWITFRDMVQMTYDEFAENLQQCMLSVWVDDDSTFGTFPLESMKCDVPVIGKIPKTQPDWMNDNGVWIQDVNKLTNYIGQLVMAWLNGIELDDEVKEKINSTLEPYSSEITKNNIVNLFNSLKNKSIDKLEEIKTKTED